MPMQHAGLDDGGGGGTAGDGVLQAGEITSTAYVCNGADGINTLVKTTPLAAGAKGGCGSSRAQRRDRRLWLLPGGATTTDTQAGPS